MSLLGAQGNIELAHDQTLSAPMLDGDHISRSPALPDPPAAGEFVPGYEASGWDGMLAPKSTPDLLLRHHSRA